MLLSGLAICCAETNRFAPRTVLPPDIDDRIVVPYPPPPAQVETLPAPPADPRCVWADGQWLWQTDRWVWSPGSWVVAESGCAWAPPAVSWLAAPYESRGRVYYRMGRWVRVPAVPGRSAHQAYCATPPPCDSNAGP